MDPGNPNVDFGDPSVDTEYSSVDSGDLSVDPEGSSVDSGDLSVDPEDSSVDSRDPIVNSRDPILAAQAWVQGIQSGTPSVESREPSVDIRNRSSISPFNLPHLLNTPGAESLPPGSTAERAGTSFPPMPDIPESCLINNNANTTSYEQEGTIQTGREDEWEPEGSWGHGYMEGLAAGLPKDTTEKAEKGKGRAVEPTDEQDNIMYNQEQLTSSEKESFDVDEPKPDEENLEEIRRILLTNIKKPNPTLSPMLSPAREQSVLQGKRMRSGNPKSENALTNADDRNEDPEPDEDSGRHEEEQVNSDSRILKNRKRRKIGE
ncbi:hypothetical protein B7494_g4060 [Chlorociboria aeruginascens]|nr:hypothetical protein B7494_g4060 [Chlorociboria aeruginascens]